MRRAPATGRDPTSHRTVRPSRVWVPETLAGDFRKLCPVPVMVARIWRQGLGHCANSSHSPASSGKLPRRVLVGPS